MTIGILPVWCFQTCEFGILNYCFNSFFFLIEEKRKVGFCQLLLWNLCTHQSCNSIKQDKNTSFLFFFFFLSFFGWLVDLICLNHLKFLFLLHSWWNKALKDNATRNARRLSELVRRSDFGIVLPTCFSTPYFLNFGFATLFNTIL